MDKETLFDMSADSLEDVAPISEVFDLSGKVAVVSGSVGLALFVINRLLECGAKVVFGARTQEWGDMALAALGDLGYEDAAFKQFDTRDVDECAGLVRFAEERFGPVDICVPVAATWQARAFLDMDEELYDDIVDTDMKGQYFLVQAAARSMVRAKHGGKIVTIASVAYRGEDMAHLAMMTPYNAAKAGVVGMTRGIAKELKQYGINVNCVAPGGMVTPGAIANCVETVARYGAEWQADQMGGGKDTPVASTPDEMARMIVTMCTNVSDFMYGKVVEVDGGAGFSFQEKPWSYTMEGGLHG
ncbi:SDR family NAD(P)-dependent oxidoreductase [Coriobacteriales bacterium OH1046]|nr:SDR family NAD(P)-dependent oxidoreductase [Coriobacteriales bacterium OH1046]